MGARRILQVSRGRRVFSRPLALAFDPSLPVCLCLLGHHCAEPDQPHAPRFTRARCRADARIKNGPRDSCYSCPSGAARLVQHRRHPQDMFPPPNPVARSGSPCPRAALEALNQASVAEIPATASLSITLDLSDPLTVTASNMGSKFWPRRGSPGILHHFVRLAPCPACHTSGACSPGWM